VGVYLLVGGPLQSRSKASLKPSLRRGPTKEKSDFRRIVAVVIILRKPYLREKREQFSVTCE
jgi:hypothetical protein